MRLIKSIAVTIAVILIFGAVCIARLYLRIRGVRDVAALNASAEAVVEMCNLYDTGIEVSDKGEYYIFGEAGENGYYLAYAGEVLEKDVLICGNPDEKPSLYWAMKAEDGKFTEAWSSKKALTKEQLEPYSFDEQEEQTSKLMFLNSDSIIGYASYAPENTGSYKFRYGISVDPEFTDTDEDGMTDLEEKELGLDPLNPETFGVPDSEYIITQYIPADDPVFRDVNTEENPYILSAEINASGYAKDNLRVTRSGVSYVMQDGSALGVVPRFDYNDDYKVKSITLYFEIKEPFTENVSKWFEGAPGDTYKTYRELEGINRLCVFRYYESFNLPMPYYTEYDIENNTISVFIDEFETDDDGNISGIGSYSVVDLEVWGKLVSRGADEPFEPDPDDAASLITKTIPEVGGEELETIAEGYKADSVQRAEESCDKGFKAENPYPRLAHLYAFFEEEGVSYEAAVKACEELGGHLADAGDDTELSFISALVSEPERYWREGYAPDGRAAGYFCEWEPDDKITNDCYELMAGTTYAKLDAPLSPYNNVDTDGDGLTDWEEIDHEAIARLKECEAE